MPVVKEGLFSNRTNSLERNDSIGTPGFARREQRYKNTQFQQDNDCSNDRGYSKSHPREAPKHDKKEDSAGDISSNKAEKDSPMNDSDPSIGPPDVALTNEPPTSPLKGSETENQKASNKEEVSQTKTEEVKEPPPPEPPRTMTQREVFHFHRYL